MRYKKVRKTNRTADKQCTLPAAYRLCLSKNKMKNHEEPVFRPKLELGRETEGKEGMGSKNSYNP